MQHCSFVFPLWFVLKVFPVWIYPRHTWRLNTQPIPHTQTPAFLSFVMPSPCVSGSLLSLAESEWSWCMTPQEDRYTSLYLTHCPWLLLRTHTHFSCGWLFVLGLNVALRQQRCSSSSSALSLPHISLCTMDTLCTVEPPQWESSVCLWETEEEEMLQAGWRQVKVNTLTLAGRYLNHNTGCLLYSCRQEATASM